MQQIEPIPIWSWGFVVVFCLVMFAVGVALAVLLAGKRLRVSMSGVASLGGVLAWVVPALAVVAIAVFQVRSHFTQEPRLPAGLAIGEAAPSILPTPVVQGRLATRQVSSDIPAWASKRMEQLGDMTYLTFISQRFATLEEAEQQVTTEIVLRIQTYFHEQYPYRGAWQVPLPVVEEVAVKQIVGEVIDKDFGQGISGKMYRVHARIGLYPELREKLHGSWRAQIVERRLLILGGLLGLVTLMLGTATAYFRLDTLSAGRFRGRLRLAAAAVIVAGALVGAGAMRFQ